MTKEEWNISKSAPEMLMALKIQNPDYFNTLIPTLHRYFLACCWEIKHLIPQKHLRNGIRGAEAWIEGKIDDDELSKLDWHAEAECFMTDYAETQEDHQEIQSLIDGIEELQDMQFEDAKKILKNAAYFAQGSMIYPKINHAPYVKSLCTSQFLCPNLLRDFVSPKFE